MKGDYIRGLMPADIMPIVGSGTIPRAKRLALTTLIGVYGACGRLTLPWHRAVASATRLCSYVRGIHLLVLEKIGKPPAEGLRLVTLTAGGATFKMALATPGLIEDRIVSDACWEP